MRTIRTGMRRIFIRAHLKTNVEDHYRRYEIAASLSKAREQRSIL